MTMIKTEFLLLSSSQNRSWWSLS